MATLATPPFVQPVNRPLGLLLPPGNPIDLAARAQPAPKLLEEPGLDATMFAWLPVVLLVPFVLFLWPVLLAALVLLLVVLTPFVVGFRVLATLRRGRSAAR